MSYMNENIFELLPCYHGTSVPVGKSITLIYAWSKHYETKSVHLPIEGFPTVPRAWQEAAWFGRAQHDKQNKIPSLIDRFGGRDLSSMDPLFTAHTMWKQNTYNFASVVAPQIDGGSGPHFMHLKCA
jgi:hypothetical protein